MFLISATLSLYLIRALLSHGIPPFLFTNKIGVVRGVMRSILSFFTKPMTKHTSTPFYQLVIPSRTTFFVVVVFHGITNE